MIRNYHGQPIDVLRFTPDMVCLESIGISLSRLPRFGGHTLRPYSVLMHTVIGVQAMELMFATEEERAAYFCHDMSEGLGFGDLCSPIKKFCSDYKRLETGVQKVIFDKYDVEYTYLTHHIDYGMGHLEADLLTKWGNDGWDKPEIDLSVFEEIVAEIKQPEFTKHYLEKYYFYCDSLLGVTV